MISAAIRRAWPYWPIGAHHLFGRLSGCRCPRCPGWRAKRVARGHTRYTLGGIVEPGAVVMIGNGEREAWIPLEAAP